jgi:hypothetical protein
MKKRIGCSRITGWWMVALAALIAVAFGLLNGSTPVGAQDNPGRTAFDSNLVINEDEVVQGNASVTGGNLVVYGEVQGDAVVTNGNADIEGKVAGDVVATGGNIQLGPHSSVGGNVLAVMGTVSTSPGAVVKGTTQSNPFGTNGNSSVHWAPWASSSERFGLGNPADLFLRSIPVGMLSLVLLLLAVAVVSVQPGRVRISSATLDAEPGPSVVVGLIMGFLLGPAVGFLAFVLAITVVGIILIPVLMVGIGLGLLFGLVVISLWLGRRIYETTHQVGIPHVPPIILEVLIGMAVLLGSTLVPAVFISWWITLLMAVLLYFVACIGIGSAILSRLGTLAPSRNAARYTLVYPSQPYAAQQSSQPAPTAPLGSTPILPTDQQPPAVL